MRITSILLSTLLTTALIAQAGAILPGQKTAITSLAMSAGFSNEDLSTYLLQNYGNNIDQLTQAQGAAIIKAFQTGAVSKPEKPKKKKVLEAASILEAGMNKRFHFRDGTVRDGEILSVENDIAVLKTNSGAFEIPTSEFLSETAQITNKKGELFNGGVVTETSEEFILRTKYGDAVIQKRDIHSMKRYHGGVLDQRSEERRKFYQGEAQLIGVFLDPTAFPLKGNTFYMSGLSLGYGLTDRFMITTKFGSNFSGDLNLHPRMRFYHKKSAEKEVAASWGLGIHRAYPYKSIIGKYSHAISVTGPNGADPLYLNDDSLNITIDQVANLKEEKLLYAEAYLVFSSRRVNPTGRGKIGWSTGIKVSNAFMGRDDFIKKSVVDEASGDTLHLAWSDESKYKLPFRYWLSLEYDLRKNLKFVGSAWIDNGYKTMEFSQTIDDYFGNDDTPSFSLDSPKGTVSMIDFDFGLLYAVNENFRIGVHFQQPYLDFYWEFFEF